jgi:hypothetical protein
MLPVNLINSILLKDSLGMQISEINQIFFQLDNNHRITQWEFTDGFIIWTRIRYQLFLILMEGEYSKGSGVVKKDTVRNNNKFGFFKNISKTISFQKKLWSFSSGWKNQKYDGICLNESKIRRPDFEGKYVPKANLVFSTLNDIKILNVYNFDSDDLPNEFYGHFACIENLIVLAKLKSKVFARKSLQDEQAINGLIDQLDQELRGFGFEISSSLDQIKRRLFYYLSYHYHLGSIFTSKLKKLTPKFLVVESGNYGGGNLALFIYSANKLGVKTIEYQHGVFDMAFEYGEKLMNNEGFKFHKTNLLLTFGEYWNEKVKYPGKSIALGSLFLSELNKEKKNKATNPYLLFISQGVHTPDLLENAMVISQRFNSKFKVIYKLHPKEYNSIEDYRLKTNQFENLEILGNVNVYELLKNTSYLISSFSTLIFEALYFNVTPLILTDFFSRAYIPSNIGIRFSNIDELIEILGTNMINTKESASYYWELNFREKLKLIGKEERLW